MPGSPRPAAAPLVTIAPAEARGGTNALLLRPPDAIDPAFGDASFEAHLRAAAAAGAAVQVVREEALGFDLDTPDDLERLAPDRLARAHAPRAGAGRAGRWLTAARAGEAVTRAEATTPDRPMGSSRSRCPPCRRCGPATTWRAHRRGVARRWRPRGRSSRHATATCSSSRRRSCRRPRAASSASPTSEPRPEAVAFARPGTATRARSRSCSGSPSRCCAWSGASSSRAPATASSARTPAWTPRTRAMTRSSRCCPRTRTGSAALLRDAIGAALGSRCRDRHQRLVRAALALGIVDVALGVAGFAPLADLRGSPDADGRTMHATVVAVADEIASAAELASGKTQPPPGRPRARRAAAVRRRAPSPRTSSWARDHDLFR